MLKSLKSDLVQHYSNVISSPLNGLKKIYKTRPELMFTFTANGSSNLQELLRSR